mmetsp:Transcript_11129/g.34245  ORF Transcript_11129/g.34245 Transcript_11129/m.34245 type:complete len:280 (+) Transcript_11129:163-1002(+)
MPRAASAKPRYATGSAGAAMDARPRRPGSAPAAPTDAWRAQERSCVWSRVFMTSSGVVRSDATAPAAPPHANRPPRPGAWPFLRVSQPLSASFAATEKQPYGTFIASVVGSDRYSDARPPPASVARHASRRPRWWPSCSRCLMTSAGVMTQSWPTTATAPAKALVACDGTPPASAPLTTSNAPKYMACAGTQATVTAPTPLNSRRAPLPVWMPSAARRFAARRQSTSGPCALPQAPTHCALVFSVSSGKTRRCSARPATEPARRCELNGMPRAGSYSSR